jgi:predicted ATPase/class 3 adenylate cyclase
MTASSSSYPGGLPSGTVTFAFTDIEGSAQRWDRNRAAMEDALRRHDAILRTVIHAYGGHIFQTAGDAFSAAFRQPHQALAAMLEVQRSLAAEDFTAVDGIHVRIAIHTGTAEERDGDYFGPALNRVARLLAIGHGEQILLSGVTSDLVRDVLPPEQSLRDLGEHRLRDLARPERVFQLTAPGLRERFPDLRSLSVLPNNLPRMLNAFVGREREIDEITALVQGNPLVTMVGAGGLGKTRTSLQVAARMLDGAGDGVWFVELAPLSSGDYIPSTIAHALGFTLPNEGDPLDNLVRALKPRHLLLILDNCEHLLGAVARVASALLRSCQRLSILASSRQALGVAGEITYRMPTLAVPSASAPDALTAADAARYAAIALFVERTRAVDQQFVLTDDNVHVIADICRRLDGIALAIELAASRVKILSPRQLRDRLDERFRVLTGGNRDALPRQQTLRALIDWSHDLLEERERVVFRRLSIFVNGFSFESAAAVASDTDIDEFEVEQLLESLVDKSLVMAEVVGDANRYRLLDSTRAYALEKLTIAGEHEMLAVRHTQHLREHFDALTADEARTGRRAPLASAFGAELEDIRAALEWALGHEHIVDGAHLLADIRRAWLDHGLETECIAWHDAYLAALPRDANRLLARLSANLATVLDNQGQIVRTREIATSALGYARAAGDPGTLLRALYAVAWASLRENRIADADTALREAEAIPNPTIYDQLDLMETRAILHALAENDALAVNLFERIRSEHRALGNTNEELRAAMNLANAEHKRGETLRAIAVTREILPAVRRDPDTTQVATVLCNLATCLVAVDDLLAAADIAREAIVLLAPTQPNHCCVSIAVEDLALAHAIRGDLTRAAVLAGYTDAALREIGYARDTGEERGYDRLQTLLRAGIGDTDVARYAAEGRLLDAEAAIGIALEEVS